MMTINGLCDSISTALLEASRFIRESDQRHRPTFSLSFPAFHRQTSVLYFVGLILCYSLVFLQLLVRALGLANTFIFTLHLYLIIFEV